MSGGVASLLISYARNLRAPGVPAVARLARWLLAFLCAFSLSPLSTRAESPDDARARAHFAAGQEYFDQERFEEAAAEFWEAYQLSGRPEMLINRARAEDRAGAPERAIASLELLFERYPQTSYREEAEQQLEKLRAELASRPPPVEAPAASAPAPVALGPTAAKSEQPARDWKLWPPRLPTLVVGGVLVASVLVSVGTGWAAHAKFKHLKKSCDSDNSCADPDDQRDISRGKNLSRVSTGFTFASIALAAATAVLWVYDVKAQKGRVSLGVRSSLAATDARLRWVY